MPDIMKILKLTLNNKWFEEIAYGRKTKEYREVKPFWSSRLTKNGEIRQYDEVWFRNGYSEDRPFMRVEWKGCEIEKWEDVEVYVISLGDILEVSNYF